MREMREIKYRAWNKKLKFMEMFNSHKSGILYAGGEFTVNSGYDGLDNPTFEEDTTDNFILMQYTGLKDKNGVKIFEGDILHHRTQGSRKVIYPMSDSFAGFGLESNNGFKNTLQDSTKLYEVIGNIHANPELLTN